MEVAFDGESKASELVQRVCLQRPDLLSVEDRVSYALNFHRIAWHGNLGARLSPKEEKEIVKSVAEGMETSFFINMSSVRSRFAPIYERFIQNRMNNGNDSREPEQLEFHIIATVRTLAGKVDVRILPENLEEPGAFVGVFLYWFVIEVHDLSWKCFRRCEQCGAYFVNPTKWKKIYCTRKCAFDAGNETKRRAKKGG